MLRYQLAGLFLDMEEVEAAEKEIEKAFQIPALSPDKITNEVERYYESVVTGRSWSNQEKKSSYVVQRLKEARSKE